ncbi:hypothetical protein GCM10009422_15780 [Brevundimonas kwangchunensis]|uniref:Lipoprotein n=1 Tax=Brevundimonas kwangchunensis TaxID=322163 RepID=A0ABN1GVL1_9CAUL
MKTMLRAAAAAALLATGACSLVTGGDLIREGEPTGYLEIRNVSRSASIDVVLVSTCSASTYGLNRLPSGHSIPAGGSYRFTVSAGCWDVGAGEVLSQNSWTQGFARVSVAPGQVTVIQSR